MNKLRAAVVGATGMVGQRFVTLLENHPYFQLTAVVASPRSAGGPYHEAVEGRWKMKTPIPAEARDMIVMNSNDIEAVGKVCDFVFCAVDMKKDQILALEEAYAKAELEAIKAQANNDKLGADGPSEADDLSLAFAYIRYYKVGQYDWSKYNENID